MGSKLFSSFLFIHYSRTIKMGAEWNVGLCGCFSNFGNCLLAYFVPCLVAGKNAEKAGTCGFCPALISTCIPFLNVYVLVKTRMDTREKHDISGSCIGDLLTTLICPFCSLIQVANQLETSAMGETMARV